MTKIPATGCQTAFSFFARKLDFGFCHFAVGVAEMGGFFPAGSDPRLAEQALWLATLCCQGRPQSQQLVLQTEHLPDLIRLLQSGAPLVP